METQMRDAATIANEYIALWNETDPKRRAEALAAGWEGNPTYVDPMMRGSGTGEINGLIGGVHAQFPGFRFKLINQPNGFGEFVRFSWGLGPADGGAPIEDSDVVVMRGERISQVIGFLDKVPQ
jgi:hypothetical protein